MPGNVFCARLALLAASALGLASCVPAVPVAGTEYDGSYIVQDSLVSGVPFQCGEYNLLERIDIRGGQFAYPFQVNPPRIAPLPVRVTMDGALSGQLKYSTNEITPFFPELFIDWAVLNGRITESTFDATMTNYRCVRRLVARRG